MPFLGVESATEEKLHSQIELNESFAWAWIDLTVAKALLASNPPCRKPGLSVLAVGLTLTSARRSRLQALSPQTPQRRALSLPTNQLCCS